MGPLRLFLLPELVDLAGSVLLGLLGIGELECQPLLVLCHPGPGLGVGQTSLVPLQPGARSICLLFTGYIISAGRGLQGFLLAQLEPLKLGPEGRGLGL